MQRTIREINQFVSKQSWLDMDVLSYESWKLIITGRVDDLGTHNIEIILEDVFFVSLPVAWTLDPELTAISLVQGDEARKVNLEFRVEVGHHIFKFEADDYPGNVCGYVAAKQLSYKILSDPHEW